MSGVTRGTELGRYLVLDRLGEGGMGVVLAAYDPVLDRRVALKLVRAELCEGSRAHEARRRLQREAQAMARLSHPNVVTVFDVGAMNEQLFVAMEFVARDLAHWLDEEERPWQSILTLYKHAAQGLAAAHAAGLVHRDFKPANVLVSADDRAQVSDFGLVAAFTEPTQATGAELGVTVAAGGAALGTPAYMAPEQFCGEVVGPAADQFAFCVALYESLYDERPFEGTTVDEVAYHVTRGNVLPPTNGTGETPAWLWPVLERGLRVDPTARHGSMAELLSAIEHDPGASKRKVVMLDAMLDFGRSRAAAGDYPVAEAALSDALVEATNIGDRRRAASAQVRLALLQSRTPDGLTAGMQRLSFVQSVLEEVPDATLEARMLAARGYLAHLQSDLTTAQADYENALRLFGTASGDAALEAVEIRINLAELAKTRGNAEDACAQLEQAHEHVIRLRGTMSPITAAVLDVWATTLQELGRFEEALERFRRALDMRTQLFGTQHPKTAESHVHVGQLLLLTGLHAEATTHLRQGLDVAEAVLGPENGTTRIALNALGGVLLRQGDVRGAWEHLERALAIAEHIYGVEHPEVATTLSLLGNVWVASGENAKGRQLHLRALEIREAALGPTHPMVVEARNNLATSYLHEGAIEPALELLLQVEEATVRQRGPEHPNVAFIAINIASALTRAQPPRLDEADARLARALRIVTTTVSEEHPAVSIIATHRGDIARLREDYDEAIAHYLRGIGLHDAAGRDVASIVVTLGHLGACLIEVGRAAEAIPHLERAVTYTAELGPSELLDTLSARLALARAAQLN